MKFTGEFMVPGKSGDRIEADHRARYSFAAKFTEGKCVLDIACGAGYAIQMLGAAEYRGVDINEDLVGHATETYGPHYEVGDICAYRSKPVDVVCCFETIEHVREYRSAIQSLQLALKPGGVLLISSPNRLVSSPGLEFSEQPLNPHHTQEFTPDELAAELENKGFTVRDTFGQRQRVFWLFRYLNGILRRLRLPTLNPDSLMSPELRPIRFSPRYFVLVAEKNVGLENVENSAS